MAIYALWNNKGGVGKSYLTFQLASEYAALHPAKRVLVIDLCPQANSSSMLLGGMVAGEENLSKIQYAVTRATISGYIEERIFSPYSNPRTGSKFVTQVCKHNHNIPENLYLVVGDDQLEIQASRVASATNPGPPDAWRFVHTWISDLIADISSAWNLGEIAVFIDCNPSFSIYTELALSASDRLVVPFSVDGSSKRAVRAVLSLVFGISRRPGQQQSEYFLNSERFRMTVPKLYMYIGNRLTQANMTAANAFKSVVNEIADEIFAVWKTHPNLFSVHPAGASSPVSKRTFKEMFQFEVNDANSASVVSGALGIPISRLSAGSRSLFGKGVQINQTQLDKQVPNIRALAKAIE